MRARHEDYRNYIYEHLISIHSPMRARHNIGILKVKNSLFQYTRPCGRDICKILNWFNRQFQYTRPCGRDRKTTLTTLIKFIFQYTRPCGRDENQENTINEIQFQYTRPCGRDSKPAQITYAVIIIICANLITINSKSTKSIKNGN